MKKKVYILILPILLSCVSCSSEKGEVNQWQLRWVINNSNGQFDSLAVEGEPAFVLFRTKFDQDEIFELHKNGELINVFKGVENISDLDITNDKYNYHRRLFYNQNGDTLDVRDYYTVDRLNQSSASVCIMNFPFEGINSFE